jgi:hypothetical protein
MAQIDLALDIASTETKRGAKWLFRHVDANQDTYACPYQVVTAMMEWKGTYMASIIRHVRAL